MTTNDLGAPPPASGRESGSDGPLPPLVATDATAPSVSAASIPAARPTVRLPAVTNRALMPVVPPTLPTPSVATRGATAPAPRRMEGFHARARRRQGWSALITLGTFALIGASTLLAAQTLDDRPAASRPAGRGIWQTSAGALGLGGGAAPGVNAPGSAGLPVMATPTPGPTLPPGPPSGTNPAPLHPWPPSDQFAVYPPGMASWIPTEPKPDPFYWAYGQCTWWAAMQRRDENFAGLGDAWAWAEAAQRRGERVGGTPLAGATVVFEPGVEGAGGGGHVAHVLAVYPGGWFLVSEMNFYWHGGGFRRVDYRYAYATWGVAFIY